MDVAIPGLEIELLDGGQIAVFNISGEVPRDCYSDINEMLHRLVTKGCRALIGDCSRAERITSTGVGFMSFYSNYLHERGGVLAVARPPEAVMRQIAHTNIEEVVPFFDTRDQALEYARAALRDEDVPRH